MKTVAAVFADFEAGLLGGPSRLAAPLGSRTVLGHTLDRLGRVAGLERRCIMIRPHHESAARALLSDGHEDVEILALDQGRRPRRGLIRSARKWNLESWRGSVCGATWFDEFVEPLCVGQVLDHYGCDAVLCCDGAQPALDPDIASAMVAHKNEHADEARFVFTQAPPGLAGIILRRDITRDLLKHDMPIGLHLSYRPEIPHGDPITRENCLQIDPAVMHTAARFTGDTERSLELLRSAFSDLGEGCTAAAICEWIAVDGNERGGPLPVEVELEITTDDPLPDTTLRPRGQRVPQRCCDDLDAIARVAADLAALDDRLLMLGGFGDPLLHPRFADICQVIRKAGVCGLGVATPLVELSDQNLDALLAQQVDVVQVLLDAHCRETYLRVQRADHFERVLANVERVQSARQERLIPQPLLIGSITRSAPTLDDIEPFFDHWIRTAGSAVISGYSAYGGKMPPDSLLSTEPPIREPCRRLSSRLMLLADGAAVLCGQDIEGRMRIGDWHDQPLAEIWKSRQRSVARTAHAELSLDSLPLCGDCAEWFRA